MRVGNLQGVIRLFVCLVFAVQVKLEEVEMETPINPPDDPQDVCLGRVKQDEREEQNKSRGHTVPEGSSTEKVPRDETETGKDVGGLEESGDAAGGMEQSEDDGTEDDSGVEPVSDSNTEHNTPEEARGDDT